MNLSTHTPIISVWVTTNLRKNIKIFRSNMLQLVTYFICHLLLGRFHRVSLSEPLSTENNNSDEGCENEI